MFQACKIGTEGGAAEIVKIFAGTITCGFADRWHERGDDALPVRLPDDSQSDRRGNKIGREAEAEHVKRRIQREAVSGSSDCGSDGIGDVFLARFVEEVETRARPRLANGEEKSI